MGWNDGYGEVDAWPPARLVACAAGIRKIGCIWDGLMAMSGCMGAGIWKPMLDDGNDDEVWCRANEDESNSDIGACGGFSGKPNDDLWLTMSMLLTTVDLGVCFVLVGCLKLESWWFWCLYNWAPSFCCLAFI